MTYQRASDAHGPTATPTSGQAALEARLATLWARHPPADSTVLQAFGPMASWILQLEGCRLLLHPAHRLWFYYDRLHATWESTGFGPGQVEFVARGSRLGYREPHQAPSQPEQRCAQCGARLRPDDHFCAACGADVLSSPARCPSCGATTPPRARFCTKCGAPLTVPGEA